MVDAPARFIIPSLGIDAAVESVGTVTTSPGCGSDTPLPPGEIAIGSPTKPDDVAWYNQSPSPGAPGEAIIDGHYNWYNATCTGAVPAVFWNLSRVSAGDAILVSDSGGANVRFVVSSVVTVPYGDGTVPSRYLQSTGTPELAIITCFGAWDTTGATYDQRTIVMATLQN